MIGGMINIHQTNKMESHPEINLVMERIVNPKKIENQIIDQGQTKTPAEKKMIDQN